jgi:hypothetical protein
MGILDGQLSVTVTDTFRFRFGLNKRYLNRNAEQIDEFATFVETSFKIMTFEDE